MSGFEEEDEEGKKNHFSFSSLSLRSAREASEACAVVLSISLLRTSKKKTKTLFHDRPMADWLSDDALLAALASEPAPLHHLTGKDVWNERTREAS